MNNIQGNVKLICNIFRDIAIKNNFECYLSGTYIKDILLECFSYRKNIYILVKSFDINELIKELINSNNFKLINYTNNILEIYGYKISLIPIKSLNVVLKKELTLDTIVYDIINDEFIDYTKRGLIDIEYRRISLTKSKNLTLKLILKIFRNISKYNCVLDNKLFSALTNLKSIPIDKKLIQSEFVKIFQYKHIYQTITIMISSNFIKLIFNCDVNVFDALKYIINVLRILYFMNNNLIIYYKEDFKQISSCLKTIHKYQSLLQDNKIKYHREIIAFYAIFYSFIFTSDFPDYFEDVKNVQNGLYYLKDNLINFTELRKITKDNYYDCILVLYGLKNMKIN